MIMINPLRHLLTDEEFQELSRLNLLNKRVLRDIQIKRAFRELRKKGLSRDRAFEQLAESFPDLQFHTLRKIVYSVTLPEEL